MIAGISYEVYCDGELVSTQNYQKFSKKYKSNELSPDQANAILANFSKPIEDKELDEKFEQFCKQGYNYFREPTIVFLVWLQDEKDEKEKDQRLEIKFGKWH